jgi:hypothetical protein
MYQTGGKGEHRLPAAQKAKRKLGFLFFCAKLT